MPQTNQETTARPVAAPGLCLSPSCVQGSACRAVPVPPDASICRHPGSSPCLQGVSRLVGESIVSAGEERVGSVLTADLASSPPDFWAPISSLGEGQLPALANLFLLQEWPLQLAPPAPPRELSLRSGTATTPPPLSTLPRTSGFIFPLLLALPYYLRVKSLRLELLS